MAGFACVVLSHIVFACKTLGAHIYKTALMVSSWKKNQTEKFTRIDR